MTMTNLAAGALMLQHLSSAQTLLTLRVVHKHHAASRSTAMPQEGFVRQLVEQREQKAAQEHDRASEQMAEDQNDE